MAEPVTPARESSANVPGEKYIRTFQGDMAVAQKGGAPDLVPVAEHQKIIAEAPPPPVAEPKATAPAAAPAPAPVWNEQVRAATLERLHAQMAADEAEGVQRSTEHSRPIGIEEEAPSPLRTYSADFSDHVKEEGAATFSVLAAEQDAGPHHVLEVAEPSPLRGVFYGAAAVLLVTLGTAGAYMAYSSYLTRQAPVELPREISAPIFVDEREALVGEGVALRDAMLASVARPLAPDTVRFLYSQSATTTRESLIVAAGLSVPNIVARNIDGQRSMAGVVQVANNQSPFFILTVSSYNETFAGMLSWEASMPRDLALFFPAYPVPPPVVTPVATTTATSTLAAATSTKPLATTTAATSTPPLPPPPPKLIFRDAVIANHDVRLFKDAQGRVVLLYGYWNPTTLIIARSEAAYLEITTRLANSSGQP